MPEILPLHVRAKGTAVGISSNWLWNFCKWPKPIHTSDCSVLTDLTVVVMITPTLLTNLAWKGYLIFMCLNFAFVPLVYFCYPETTNLTLEEIDWLFLEKDAVKRSRIVAKHGWGDENPWQRRANRLGVPEKDGEATVSHIGNGV